MLFNLFIDLCYTSQSVLVCGRHLSMYMRGNSLPKETGTPQGTSPSSFHGIKHVYYSTIQFLPSESHLQFFPSHSEVYFVTKAARRHKERARQCCSIKLAWFGREDSEHCDLSPEI